jgi:heme/copper-type cytochrome/quinol oxidase subunit 3
MAAPMLALESGDRKADPSLVTFGVLTLCVSLLVAFGALFGAWLSLRSGTAVWPPKGATIENYFGTTLSLTMFIGVLVVEWAAWSVRNGERAQVIAAYTLLTGLGVAFLNLLTYVVHLSHFGPGTHPYGAVYYAFNVLMIASVALAVLAALLALARFLGGQVSAREPALARSAAWIWHTVTAGWVVMYWAIYVVK